MPYFETKYLKIKKNGQLFLIENVSNLNLNFWKNIYTNWENEKFSVFDKYLDKNKIFIDIGAWIGTTAMYGSRKSKHVYSIEADIGSFDDLSKNCEINCEQNYTLINKAIYNIDNIDIKFGKNKFLSNSRLNDSTSQIYSENETSNEFYNIKSITLDQIIKENQINPNEISLIKVDIEGGEEDIMEELYSIHKKYNIPLYLSFHHHWWKDKNLDRFSFLTDSHKKSIERYPIITILFKDS
jgi:FkbM family methyltransferase